MKSPYLQKVVVYLIIPYYVQGRPLPVVNGVISPISMVISYDTSCPSTKPFIGATPPFITGRGPPCKKSGIRKTKKTSHPKKIHFPQIFPKRESPSPQLPTATDDVPRHVRHPTDHRGRGGSAGQGRTCLAEAIGLCQISRHRRFWSSRIWCECLGFLSGLRIFLLMRYTAVNQHSKGKSTI